MTNINLHVKTLITIFVMALSIVAITTFITVFPKVSTVIVAILLVGGLVAMLYIAVYEMIKSCYEE